MTAPLEATQQVVFTFTLEQLWSGVLALAAAITAIAGAVTVITKVVKSLKAPDNKQNERLSAHDKALETVTLKLSADKEALDLYHSEIIAIKEHQKEQDVLLEEHSRKVAAAEQRLDKNDRSLATIMQSLLALLDCNQSLLMLLDHGADSNVAEPIQKAKAALEDYLINR